MMTDVELLEFVKNNINDINTSISSFKDKTPNDTIIKDFLRKRFTNTLPDIKEELIKEFCELNYVKSKISDIASKFILYKSDVENFLMSTLYVESLKKVNSEKILNAIITTIENQLDNEYEYKFIKND